MPIFLALIAVPLAEIATFILVGGAIGVAATLLMTLLTAVAGTILLRQQGFAVLNRIRDDLARDRMPGRPLADGAMIAAAGIMLLTPGFITDSIGLLLFIPAIRDVIWRIAKAKFGDRIVASASAAGRSTTSGETRIVDLDENEYRSRNDPSSPWSAQDGD